ncbi:MAG: hypothetical protein XU10_C0011G0032 [Chloroflexi bacterium CSP1-4]|nr:MAG: hypothetical protein XU10_C0011G0032 [Chloroflexi bacterium CSP1-4]
MERIRIRWAAFVAALLLIVSMAGVAGATYLAQPSAVGAPHAQAAPAAEDEDQDADGDTDGDSDTDEGTDGAQGEHGALVSAAAHDKDCVGGKNHNHGGAVSEVARGEVTEAVCDATTDATTDAATDATTDAKANGGKSKDHRKDAVHRP